MKKYIISASLLLLVLLAAQSALAKSADGEGNVVKDANNLLRQAQNTINNSSKAAVREQEQIIRLKQQGDKMVTQRIASLNILIARINNDKRLTSDEKTALSSDVQNAISGLTALKTKIDADTTVGDLKADIKQIATNYKVYEVLEPKMRILVVIDNLQDISNRLSRLSPKLQVFIDDLKGQNKNVSDLPILLNDINSNLSAINTKLSADKIAIMNISVNTVNAKDAFVSVRKDLAQVRADFAKIRHDIALMRENLKGVLKNTTAGPSLAPSAVPLN
ncbi:MAG: hypothetical protein Q7R31_04355 [Candidatus Levybacteria bacterium]|nr:hypothetical protein [Candidatus Levybacteria bacterium]